MFPFGFSKLFVTMQVVDREEIPEIQVGNSEYIDNSKRLTCPFTTGH